MLRSLVLHLGYRYLLRLQSREERPHARQHQILELELIVHLDPIVEEEFRQVSQGHRKLQFGALLELKHIILGFEELLQIAELSRIGRGGLILAMHFLGLLIAMNPLILYIHFNSC